MSWKKNFHGKIDPFSVYFEASCWKNDLQLVFNSPSSIRFRYVDGDFYYWSEDEEKIKEDLLQDSVTKIDFCNQTIKKISLDFLQFCKDLGSDFRHKSNQELLNLFNQFCEEYRKTMVGWQHPLLIEEVLTILLQKQLQEAINPEKDYFLFKEVFSSFFIPEKETEMFRERKELLLLAIKGVTEERLQEHAQKYAYLGLLLLSGEPWTRDSFRKRLQEISNPKIKLKELQETSEDKHKQITAKIKDARFPELVQLAKDISYLRTFHLEKTNEGCFYARPFLTELAKRMGLSYPDLTNLIPEEIESYFRNEMQIFPVSIEERKKGYVIINDPEIKIFIGKEVEHFKQEHLQQLDNVTQISGLVAYRGKITGTVKVLYNVAEMSKVNKGDIIVAQVTTPDFVPVMEKAAAFITDIGGITSHAAIIAREMKKPCIVGTEIATKVFKDGDLVEVDAEKGIVRKIG